jgi:hypothetical protein
MISMICINLCQLYYLYIILMPTLSKDITKVLIEKGTG